MPDSKHIRNRLNIERGKQIRIAGEIEKLTDREKETRREIRRYEQAREIIRAVGLKTQEQLQYHISDITSMALEAVFDDPYELLVEFVQRRNKTECDLLFQRDGNTMDPMGSSGVGSIDVASLALRVVAWSMQSPRTRNTIILDEPFRNLSVDNQERASQMLKELSEKLGLQLLIVTHSHTLTESADRIFSVRKRNRKSYVK